jgi:hypothetical protein
MKGNIILIGLFLMIMISCKKSNNQAAKMFYSYYPTEVNSWVEYEGRRIIHVDALGSDTAYFYLKEVITEEFIDNQGRTTFRVERFEKDSLHHDYVIKDVWYSNITTTTAEKVEENIRFTKLIFPISGSKSWDGNANNTIEKWTYEYDSIHEPRNYNSLDFDSTVKVMQIDNINPFQYQVAYEVYANYVGLVRKSYINIDNGDGDELELTVIDYGK